MVLSVAGDTPVVGCSAEEWASEAGAPVDQESEEWVSVGGASVDEASVEELSADDEVSKEQAFVDEASEDWAAVNFALLSVLNLDSWVLKFHKGLLSK